MDPARDIRKKLSKTMTAFEVDVSLPLIEKINRLKKGDPVLVLGKEFSWYKVQLPADSLCFIHSKYVQLQNGRTGIVTADKVNLRAAPHFNASVLAQAAKGTVLTIFGKKEDWYQAQPPESSCGWIAADLVAFKSSDISLMPKPAKAPAIAQNAIAAGGTPAASAAVAVSGQKATATLTVSGTLDKSSDGSRFKLMAANDARYFLDAPPDLLKEFLNQQVRVEGQKTSNPQFPSMYPVLVVNKIELVL